MKSLNKALAPALLAALAFGGATQASAQPYGRSEAIRQQIVQLERQVERNDDRNRISNREADALRGDIRRLKAEFRDYNRNGLSRDEMRRLESRIEYVRNHLRTERRDDDSRRW